MLSLFVLVGGCGGGGDTGSSPQQFYLQVLGPAGGTASAGPVTVTFPPGALPTDTSVAILPELNPLPITPPPNDTCVYGYLEGIHCCGPLSLQLLVPAILRVSYDESLIPPGLTEADLVLLVSDPATNNTTMVPKIGGSVTQYTASNYFEDTNYNPLGHVAVGIRTCPAGRILVNNVLSALQGPGGSTSGFLSGELYVVDPLGVEPPAPVSTDGEPFGDFLASPSGDRVLLRTYDPQTQGTRLATVPLPGGGVPVTVFADDPSNSIFLQAYDPHYGWLKGSASDQVFAVVYESTLRAQGATVPPETYTLWRRDADALQAPAPMRQRDAGSYYPDDLRQSADGSHAMLRWGTIFEKGGGLTTAFVDGAVDVITSPAAGLVSEGLIPPNGFGGSSPRFMTGSDDLYVIEFGERVLRYRPDGTLVGTLFDPGFEAGEVIVDFALAPDDQTFAMVVEVPDIEFIEDEEKLVAQGLDTPGTVLTLGTLSEGVQADFPFYSQQYVQELVWHPQQTGVFLSLSGSYVGFYRLMDDDGFYIDETTLPAPDMSYVDVNRIDGRIAVVLDPFYDLIGPTAEALPTGLYVSPPDAQDFQPVGTFQLTAIRQARWVESWRNQPGMGNARVR